MIRRVLRFILTVALLVSLAGTAWTLGTIWTNPLFSKFVDASSNVVAARLDRMAAKDITQEALDAKLENLLAAEPRNWLAIEAVEEAAAAEGLAPNPEVATLRANAWEQDSGWIVVGEKCAKCAWDPKACDLSSILICRAPVDLTPLGDVAGVVRESSNYLLGNEVDMFDLTLSTVGLGAVLLVPATLGGSAAVKAGATFLRTGRKLGSVTPRMTRFITRTGEKAIDWKIISATRPGRIGADVKRAVNPDALRPLMSLATDAGKLRGSLGLNRALHVLRHADTPDDARKLVRVVEASGPKAVGRLEFLGKSRIIRATLRYSDEVIGLGLWVGGLGTSVLALLGQILTGRYLRRARRALRPKKGA